MTDQQNSSELMYGLLGPLLVKDGDREIELTSAMQRKVMTILLLNPGDVVSADFLEFALWADSPPKNARKNLHTLISRLRASVGIETIKTSAPGYLLDVAPHEIDAVNFERMLLEAQALIDTNAANAYELTKDAEELWRGPAIAEFGDEEFARSEALRLEESRLVAAEVKFEALIGTARPDLAIPLLEGFVASNPYRERPHHLLMAALYQTGRVPEALNVYRRYRDRLVEEMGIDPSPEIQELEVRILTQDSSLPGIIPSQTARYMRRTSVPAQTTRVVGRDRDLVRLSEALGQYRLVSVVGPPGVGKTRLASTFASSHESISDVYWCELAGVDSDSTVPEALMGVLRIQPRADVDVVEVLVEMIGDLPYLIVLDNCEHVIDGTAALVERLTHGCPRLKLLITSREPLGLPSEQVSLLQPLAIEDDNSVGGLSPAMELFADRAAAARPGFEITEQNRESVYSICRRLDGLPLAIELAAASLRSFTPEEIAARLEDDLSLSPVASRTMVERHRTIESAISWSYGRLTEAERIAFDRLSVFSGGFDMQGAEDLARRLSLDADQVGASIPLLVERSLVSAQQDDRVTRYRQLDTIRRFGRSQLEARGTLTSTEEAHSAWAASLSETLAPMITGSDEHAAVSGYRRELANFRAAHNHSVAWGDVEHALRLSVGLHHFAYQRLRDEVFSWAESAIAMPGADTDPLYPAVLGSLAQGLANRGDLERATAFAELGMRKTSEGEQACRQVQHALSVIAIYSGELESAVAHAEREIEESEYRGDVYQAAFGNQTKALALHFMGRSEESAPLIERHSQLAVESGNTTLWAWNQVMRAETAPTAEALSSLTFLEGAIRSARRVGNVFVEGSALDSIAGIRATHDDPNQALRLFGPLIEHWARHRGWTHQLNTLKALLLLLLRLDRHRDAAVLHGVISANSTVAPPFGGYTARLETADERLAAGLSPDELDAAVREGEMMSRQTAITYARSLVTPQVR